MTIARPNFSPFPYGQLRRVSRREAALESALARWAAAAPERADHLGGLLGGAPRLTLVSARRDGLGARAGGDPHGAVVEVRAGAAAAWVIAPAGLVRAAAQRLLGGPAELPAPRPLGAAERAIAALLVAAALADAGIAAEAWPLAELPDPAARAAAGAELCCAEVAIEVAEAAPAGGGAARGRGAPGVHRASAVALVPAALLLRVPPRRAASVSVALPIAVARCDLPRRAAAALAVRDVITVDPGLALIVGRGQVGLRAAPGAMAATVATSYVPRPVTPVGEDDDARLELSVELGTTLLSVRRLADLAVGEVIPLGRPLAGPYDLRLAGQRIGHGELVDVDGELGVRILSLTLTSSPSSPGSARAPGGGAARDRGPEE